MGLHVPPHPTAAGAAAAASELGQGQWVFARRPVGRAATLDDFELQPCPAPPPCGRGEALLRPHLISVDPTMRNSMSGPDHVASTTQTASYYRGGWQLGSPPSGRQVAVVMDVGPDTPGFSVGDLVVTRGPWALLHKADTAELVHCEAGLAPESNIATLGTGMSAVLPCKHIGQPKPGETAFVSGAAGMTGFCAAQTLKLLGCARVIGSAGTDEKCAELEAAGVQSFNYKTEAPLSALQRLCPDGLDIYFGAQHPKDRLRVLV